MQRCFNCQKAMELKEGITEASLCPHCQKPVHCCFNCRFYAPGARFDCLQPLQEPVRFKNQAQACPAFAIRVIEIQKKAGQQTKAMNKLDDLFKSL